MSRLSGAARHAMMLYFVQRGTALVMAPLVLGHLAVILYAAQGGLSAGEILGRTQGSVFWAGFYGLFVIAAALHGAVGLRNVVAEMTPWRGRSLLWAAALVAMALSVLGLRAVIAVVAP
jgi:fumarate reductase subunit C